MSNPQKRLILNAVLSAGLVCASAAYAAPAASTKPGKPAPKATQKPARVASPTTTPRAAAPSTRAVAPSSTNVRAPGMGAIAARPRVAVRPTSRPVVRTRSTRSARGTTAVRRTSRRTVSRLANQPGMGRRGAFSAGPLRSKDALMRELRGNSSLRRNLARHFSVPESRIVAYVDNNLKFNYLQRSVSSVVFGVSKQGRIFNVRQRLPKGTPVFTLSDRTPVIKSICGNPIVFRLPPVPKPVAQFGPIKPPGVMIIDVEPEPVVGRPIPPGTLPLTAYAPPLGDADLPPTFEVATESAPVGTLDVIPGAVRRGGGGAFPWWIAGAGIPFFFLDDDDDDGNGLIPEPNSIALFAAGGVPLIAWWRRRRNAGEDEEETPEDSPSE